MTEETAEQVETESQVDAGSAAEPSQEAAQSADGAESPQPLEHVEASDEGEQVALIEALLFASGEPLSGERIAEICKITPEEVMLCVQELTARYAQAGSGFEIVTVAEQYQLRTRALFAPYLRVMRAGRPRRLSNAALETLAIVAYRQPVVKSDIEKIRGVDVTPTLKTLLERALVRIVGHQPTVGQPALYGTTDEFLKLFGLSSLGELPTLRDIKELERDPGESGLDEGEAEVSSDDVSREGVQSEDGTGDIAESSGDEQRGGVSV